jgi:acyl-CoA thioester hydrolase
MKPQKVDLSQFSHSLPIQIRFVDIDRQGHVNNATILSYFETERVHFLDGIIGTENDWERRGLVIAHSEIDYLQPVFIRDKIRAYSRIADVGTKSFKIENALVKTGEGKETILCIASFVLVCMNYHTQQTIEIPTDWKKKFLELLAK